MAPCWVSLWWVFSPKRVVNDLGNGLGMLAGFLVVAYLSGLDQGLAATVGWGQGISRPDWMPVVEFPWRIFFGTIVTFAVAVSFPTSLGMQRHRYLAEK